ncbi:MAG: M14 metallopeptidase family protein [Gemmatimonadaceae bacterium]
MTRKATPANAGQLQLAVRPFLVVFALLALLGSLATTPMHATAQHSFSGGAPASAYDPAIPTPGAALGHDIGEWFTPHHAILRYAERLAEISPRVRLDTVALTFEGRELMLAVVTSEANQARIDEIRADANRIGEPLGIPAAELDAAAGRVPAIAWLGYTVHGNEASGTEASLALLYQLAAGSDAETRMILDSVVVLIDPVQNPDGHERHVQDVTRMRGALGVPVHPDAMIHQGSWPGARTSHYYFDLNRDWFILSHPETRGRVATFRRWHPHVGVDLHEMGSNSTYFFAPPMEPVNANVDESIIRWWDIYAAANATAFDEFGWSYFRREGYDEFYPGYGVSWPILTGAVGMTYEQASSRGGAIRRDDGTILTLREAAHHHYTAAWATLTTSALRARERVRSYLDFRRSAITDGERAAMRTVVIARGGQGRADTLARRLLENGIRIRRLEPGTELRDAMPYGGERAGSARLERGGWLVDLAQPQGRLARAILEPNAELDSSFIAEELESRRTGESDRFYDLTAWSLPFTYRVQAWWTRGAVGGGEIVSLSDSVVWPADSRDIAELGAPARYGYAFEPGSEPSMALLALLLRDSVRVWHAPRSFRVGGNAFPHGAFVVRVAANDSGVHELVRRRAGETNARVVALGSAGVDEGTDLGSNSVQPVNAPRVALLGGAPVSGNSFGFAWYAFDQRLRYPVTKLDVGAVRGGALADFDVLVVPSVSSTAMQRELGESGSARIADWVRAGGILIAIERAMEWIADEDSDLARIRLRSDTVRADGDPGAPLPARVPGAIVRAIADTLSPLLAGVNTRELPVLVFSDLVFTTPPDVRPGELVIRYAPENRLRLSGYLWPEVPARLAGTPYLWTEGVGNGRVIGFAGDPNFRDLWRGLLPLFANAVFLGPTM